MKDKILEKLADAVLDGNEEAAEKIAKEAIDMKIDPVRAIKEGLSKGMDIIGKKFRVHEIFISQVMLSAYAMKAGLAVLQPALGKGEAKGLRTGTVVLGTVFGDIHDIGKDLVGAMLTTAGFEVYDLGTEVSPIDFVTKSEEVKADAIALSSLMTSTKFYQQDVIRYLNDMGLREKYLVIIGGGAVTPEWAEEIGADGYGRFATDAAEILKILLKKGNKVKRPLIIGEVE